MRAILVALADQALSSATNVALTIVVAHTAGLAGLGAFGIAHALYLILVGLSRALSGEPLLVRHEAGSVSAATGLSLVNGLAGGVVVLAVGVLLGGPSGTALVALAVFLPGLLLKDAWRLVFIAAGRPERAVLNDAVWAAGQVALIGWLVAAGDPSAGGFVAAWGAAATIAAIFGAVQSRVLPLPWRVGRWLRAHRDLLPGYTVDFAARMGGRQVAFLCVGIAGGLPALGAIRAAEVVFGVLNVALQGVHLVLIPYAVGAAKRSRAALGAAVTRLTLCLVVAAGAYGALALLIPDDLGRAILGTTWTAAEPVVLAECALFAGIAAITGPAVGLRALGDARRGATVRLLVVPMSVGFGAAGAALGGGPGAVYGLALANAVGLALWLWQLRAALRSVPETAPAVPQPVSGA